MKRSELTKEQQSCLDIFNDFTAKEAAGQPESIKAAWVTGKGIHDSLDPKFKPKYPTKTGWHVFSDGEVIQRTACLNLPARRGRTFHTCEEAEKFSAQERAQAYCLSRIHEVNKGDNGFKKGGDNYSFYFHWAAIKLDFHWNIVAQSLPSDWYIRTEAAAKELQEDAEFVKNWKIANGVEL